MKKLIVILFSLTLLASAACGGGADDAGDSDSGSTTTTRPSDNPDDPAGGGEGTEEGEGEHDEHDENADFPAADATDIAKISTRDFVFVDMPATVTGPKLRIEASNDGPSAHEIVVFDADGTEIGGVEPFLTGDSAELSVELPAGTYELRCEIALSDTETHFDRGMRATFAVM